MSDSKKKQSNYNIDADNVEGEEFEIVDINGEKGILTLEFDDLIKEKNKHLSEEELQKIADNLIVNMFGAPKDEQN